MKPLIHLASTVFNSPLAILPEKLEAILRLVGPRFEIDQAAVDQLASSRVIPANGNLLVVQEGIVARFEDDSEEESKPYKLTPQGVAVLRIAGPLVKRHSWLSAACGMSSYANVGDNMREALSDPAVKGLLLDIDSPGGVTHGCFELSDAIRGMRGEKPIWSVANDLATSAAYAIASATDRVYVTRTGGIGSIGVFAVHVDQSGADTQEGVKYTYVFAGDRKVDGNPHEPLSKSARSDIQAEVDREYGMFIAAVAANRNAEPGEVAKTQARVYYGDKAPKLLADGTRSLEEATAELGARTGQKQFSVVALDTKSGNNAEKQGAEIMPATPQETAAVNLEQHLRQGEAASYYAAALDEAAATNDHELYSLALKYLVLTGASIETTGKENAMPKGEKEELKRAKKDDDEDLQAADPKKDDEEEEEEEDGEDKAEGEESKKKALATAKRGHVTELPRSGRSPEQRIAELCMIAGAPELAADYITKGYSVSRVSDLLMDRRSKASAENPTNSYVPGDKGVGGSTAQSSIDQAVQQALTMSANSGGKLNRSQALAAILRSNPQIYQNYLEERDRVIAQSPSGAGRVLTEWVMHNQRRYLGALGLGTTIDVVPSGRGM